MKTDQHLHTLFSEDSLSTPEIMADRAIEKGLDGICFTDHCDKDDFDFGPSDQFNPEAYFSRMKLVQERFQGKLQIRIGVELGLQPHLADFYQDYVARYPFDFVIGSVHSVARSDLATLHFFEGRTDQEAYHAILQEMLEDVRAIPDFDVLGHLDYMTRYGTQKEQAYSYAAYADEIDLILQELIASGRGIELNTSGLRYGLPYMHPCEAVLKRYRELGGEIITVGSDAHRPDQIACDFAKAKACLRACGFAYYTEFVNRKPVFYRVV